ncbi:heparinase II/III domain-containing protein [Neobacillus dielmonensis]|uniref:heparinase II/III domain-containing protein n=1 Tax=Neobacillus dielmonensis TaxID=1347369 RepID=UPI00069385B4|nr:heparinase II/III family protein [Neobacillus dielmonensis]
MKSIEEYFSGHRINQPYTKVFQDEVEQHIKTLTSDKTLLLPKFEGYLAYLEDGNRKQLEDVYFKRRKDATSLALYLQWEQNEEKWRLFEEMLFSICQEYSWALPAHIRINGEKNSYTDAYETVDLFASETAHFLAECTVLFKNKLTPALLSIMKTEIQRRVLIPFVNREWKFERLTNNWSAVCAGSIGMAAMILLEDGETRHRILQRVEKAMECFLQGYGEDGACVEGMGYWVYGVGYYSYFADMYEQVEGKDLFTASKWRNIAAFPLKAMLPSGNYLPFSDSPEKVSIPSGLNAFFFKKFGIVPAQETAVTDFHFDHCYRWGHLSRILWWSKQEVRDSFQQLNGEFILDDAKWVIVKQPDFYFAAKGGHNDESHNHNDLGHFVLGDAKGLVFDDLGAPVYTADYFGEKRYEFVHTRSFFHSVPYLDHQEQREGRDYQSSIEEISQEPGRLSVVYDLHKAYSITKDSQFTRTYTLAAGERELRIKDAFTQPIPYETHFITRIKPDVFSETLSWNHGQWTLHFDKELFMFELEELEISNHFGEKETVFNLKFISKDHNRLEFDIKVSWLDGEKDE